MRCIVVLFLMIFTITSQGQKVDIDKFKVYISNTNLPLNYIPMNERIYSVGIFGNSELKGVNEKDNVKINGWEVSKEKPTLVVEINLGQFSQGSPYKREKTEDKKDKDGKVISKTTTYWYSSSNSISAEMKISGIKNELSPVKDQNEKEKKTTEVPTKKEKEIAANPFLSGVNTKVKEEVEDNLPKGVAYKIDLGNTYTYETSKHLNAADALKEYDKNIETFSQNNITNFRNSYAGNATSWLNKLYGYGPIKHGVKFQILDSKKHPEYEMFYNATQALKVIFEKMRYNKPIDEIKNDLKPIIDYYESVANKYSSDDKNDIKLKEAALYNLAQTHHYLDNHDKAIAVAELMIPLSKKSKSANAIIKESTEIKRQLAFHHMTSRHVTPLNVSDDDDSLGDDSEVDDDDND